ncbi:MAG TPA: HAMP domain-containing histidine kinase [Thiothrix sp.]|nr:HAMP domain-containing histidine kinase [Thiothrix sp.]
MSIEQRLQARYKRLFTRVVLQVMVVTSVFLFVSHFRLDSPRLLSGIIVLLLVVAINAYLSTRKQPIKTPFGYISCRSESIDTLRWCINFPLDVYIYWSLDVNPIIGPVIWILLTFGAMTEIYEPRNKLMALSVALMSFVFLVTVLSPTDLKTEIYLISCYLGLLYVFWSLERYIFDEMTLVYQGELQRTQLENEAAQLEHEAAVGRITRSLGHELSTLLSAANLSVEGIQNSTNTVTKDVDRLKKSLAYMSHAATLILDDLGNHNTTIRQLSLAELLHDVRLLIVYDPNHVQIRFSINFPVDAEQYSFKERRGSTYLIISNLVKNAYEAVEEKFSNTSGGVITLSALCKANEIVLTVTDNGIGMSSRQLNDINHHLALSSKITGHGLGLQFVQRECQQNAFGFSVDSQLGIGSEFAVLLK